MSKSLAIAYNMKKKQKKMADGGPVIDPDKAKDFQDAFRKSTHYAKGGETHPKPTPDPVIEGLGSMPMEKPEEYDDLKNDFVDRIMTKMSKGGEVANDTPPIADEMPADYDDLALDDSLESHYGEDDNSGDALGNKQEDEDQKDIVSRIMASRKKKDRNPRPA